MNHNRDRGKEGRLRKLTAGEIWMAYSIFGNTISYHRVWVHKESYLPFGLQNENYGMTPNGELYFRDKEYSDDYSLERPADQHFFIHEMGHVYQYQHGMNVRLRGVMSFAEDYTYELSENKYLNDYNMEQQASIIADFYYFRKYGRQEFIYFNGRKYTGVIDELTMPKYEAVLKGTGFSR